MASFKPTQVPSEREHSIALLLKRYIQRPDRVL